MRLVIAFISFIFGVLAAQAASQPAGNIISYKLAGEDLARGTAVIRKGGGGDLAPQIYMPLYEDDVIFLNDTASQIIIDIVNEPRQIITGPKRYTVVGKLPMTDDTRALWESIMAVFTGTKTGGDAETDLVSKGYGISLPSAAAGGGTNLITSEGGPVALIWKGGKAPYVLFIDRDGTKEKLGETGDQMFRFQPPSTGAFIVTVEDSEISIARLRFDVRPALPAMPDGLLAAAPSEAVAATLLSGWLAGIDGGEWRLEAIRRLDALAEKDDGASRLLYVMSEGWPE